MADNTDQPKANEEQTEQQPVTETTEEKESEKTESEIVTEEKVDGGISEKPTTPQDFMKRAAQIRQEGNDLFRTEDFDASILKYVECMRIVEAVVRHIKENGIENFDEDVIEDVVKQRVTTYTNLGVTFKKVGQIRKAYEYICKALDNDENNLKALFVRAKIYYETKHYLEAKSDIDDLLQLSPTNKEALALQEDIGQALKRAKENDVLNAQQYVQRMQQMGMGGMMGGMNIFEMMGMGGGGMGRYKSREEMEKEELEKALEISRQEFAKEEEKRKREEEEKQKVDAQQEEMRKYFESLKTPSGEDKVDDKVFEEEEDEDDDAFVLDDDDDEDGEDGDDDDDDDDDSEPIDNQSDEDE